MAPVPVGGDLLTSLLRDVSRSFYLTLRVLPAAVRPSIGLAYLLARATDTIADTELLPVETRLAALDQLRARILGTTRAGLDFRRFIEVEAAAGPLGGASPAERLLLTRIEEALAALAAMPPGDQARIREVLMTITSGQELDLRRFASVDGPTNPAGRIVSLQTDAELDDYTYRVAGCVGEFWTKTCRACLFPRVPLDMQRLLAEGIRFGKGLQLVNILRDLPADLRKGRSYLPAERLAASSLAPADLLAPETMPRLRPLYDHYLNLAEAHLAAGWDYTNRLPRGQTRIRLACAWPVLIGVKTLQRLRSANVLDAAQRVKISRADVRGVLFRSLLASPFEGPWRELFAWAKK